MIDSPTLLNVATALVDGTPVDWDEAAQSATTDEERRLLAELRFISQMTRPSRRSVDQSPHADEN